MNNDDMWVETPGDDTYQILIDNRADRTAATHMFNTLGIPQRDRYYYSRAAALAEFGNRDARYLVTNVNARRLHAACRRYGLTLL